MLREKSFGTTFWKKKAKQRLSAHGKEYAAQQALLAKLVAAPGEYKRRDGFDLEELLAEEDKKADKEHEKKYNEGDEDNLAYEDEESSVLTGATHDGQEKQDEDEESENSEDKMTAEHIAHLLDNDA